MDADTKKTTVIQRSVLRSTISNYLGKVITLAAGFLLTPLLIQRLGETNYGLWILAGSVVTYGTLLDLGIGSAVVKYVAEYQAKRKLHMAGDLVRTALYLYTGLGLLALISSVVIAFLFPVLFDVPTSQRSTAIWVVLLLGLGLSLSIPGTTGTAVLRGLHRFDLTNFVGVAATLSATGATAAAVLLGGGVVAMVAVSIPISLIWQGVTFSLIRRVAPELHFTRGTVQPELVRRIIGFSSSLFVIDVASRLQAKTDEIVIAAFLPVSMITPYSVAHRLSDLPQILTDQFMKVLMPLASELHAQNDTLRLQRLYTAGTRLSLAIFVPIGCTAVMLAGPILALWIGPFYATYAPVVVILTLASLVATSQWPAGSILQGMERHRLLALTSLASGITNVGLSIALIGPLGLTGCALATLIPTVAECLGFVMPYTMRVVGVNTATVGKEVFLPVLLPVIPQAAALYLLPQIVPLTSLPPVAIVAAVGVLLYSTIYLGIGASPEERQTYRSIALNAVQAVARLKRS